MSGADGVQPWPTILVIDPDLQRLSSFRTTLEIEGYTTLIASSGHAGLVAFEACQPDCVLLAVRLPDLDGVEVCQCLRTLRGGRDTPIIMLSAEPDLDTCDEALLAGCDDVVLTPTRPSELLKQVRAALKLRHLGARLREQCAQLHAQRDALMRFQLQNERWTAFMFHDLKAQVQAMDRHSQRLSSCQTLPLTALESVQQLCEQARALRRLVLSLLDISKSQEGRLVPRSVLVDLRALVHGVVGAAEVTAHKRGVKLVQHLEVTSLSADPELLARVLDNLVDNALRRAPSGSAVHITAQRKADSAVELRVIDAGAEITAEWTEEGGFEPFLQLEHDNARRGSECAPALLFCKLAISAHGGTIHVEPAVPGAAVCIRIPSPLGRHSELPASA